MRKNCNKYQLYNYYDNMNKKNQNIIIRHNNFNNSQINYYPKKSINQNYKFKNSSKEKVYWNNQNRVNMLCFPNDSINNKFSNEWKKTANNSKLENNNSCHTPNKHIKKHLKHNLNVPLAKKEKENNLALLKYISKNQGLNDKSEKYYFIKATTKNNFYYLNNERKKALTPDKIIKTKKFNFNKNESKDFLEEQTNNYFNRKKLELKFSKSYNKSKNNNICLINKYKNNISNDSFLLNNYVENRRRKNKPKFDSMKLNKQNNYSNIKFYKNLSKVIRLTLITDI